MKTFKQLNTHSPTARSNSSGRVRDWAGPAVLTYGYRPFFLMAGIWAAFAMTLWVTMLAGWLDLPSRFDPVSWHAHAFLFGYLGAVMAGFMLTAVPNWTGRLPILGWPLGALAALWVVGRIAVGFSTFLPTVGVAVLDLAFPVVLAALIGREIIAGKTWRNLVFLVVLGLFILANGLFHLSAARGGSPAQGFGFRMGLAGAVMLIGVVGGRIVPSFTRNWLAKQRSQHFPAAFGRFDRIALTGTGGALVLWTVLPLHPVTGAACGFAGLAGLIRQWRWLPWRTGAEPLLWILHVGFLFVPLGFLAIALAIAGTTASPMIGAQHIWMAGAIGVMTVAVMTRASLGHAGLPLKATRAVTGVYLALLGAVALRFIAAFGTAPGWVLDASAGAWIIAFASFSVVYWPILTKSRAKTPAVSR